MHANQFLTLADWKTKWPKSFENCKVLELGSLNAAGHGPEGPHGTVRIYFNNCEFVGIDKQSGLCVDIVVEAKDTKFTKNYFDTLISSSMFEHDPEWKESLAHNIQWIRPGSMLFFNFGAEGNNVHNCGGFHIIVPHKEFLSSCRKLGLEVLESFWEEEKWGGNSPGSYCVVCKKPESK